MSTDDNSSRNVVTDNTARNRFELAEAGETAFANYSLDGGVLTIPYVESPPALRGTGVAGRLMGGVVAHARARNLKILPTCGYAVSWFQRHPEHSDLLG